jgi:HAD superfamily hydrolase (TIGR01509 family)
MVDSEPLHYEAMRRVLAKRGVTYTLDDKLAVTGGVVRESVRKAAAKYGLLDQADELYRERIALFEQLAEEDLQLRPGVQDLLRRMKARRLRCAVVTSGERAYVTWALDHFGIEQFFQVVVCAEDLTRHKPDPAPYLRAAEKLRVDPGECVALEDSRTGLLAAKAAGMTCIVVPNVLTMHQDFALADRLYDSLQDLSERELDVLLQGGGDG